jgi:hypothetical protein
MAHGRRTGRGTTFSDVRRGNVTRDDPQIGYSRSAGASSRLTQAELIALQMRGDRKRDATPERKPTLRRFSWEDSDA